MKKVIPIKKKNKGQAFSNSVSQESLENTFDLLSNEIIIFLSSKDIIQLK